MKEGVDYIVYYKNNINVGTATLIVEGIEKYQGVAGSANFEVSQTISACSITGINAKTYTGNKITQSIVIKDGSTKLEENKDYTIEYQDNVNVGTAKVIITGKGKYPGTVTKTFTIKPVPISVSGISDKTYTGNSIYQNIVVKRGSETLIEGTDYKVTYSQNKEVGIASIVITGITYDSAAYETFNIRPNKVTNLKAATIGENSVKLTWSKRSNASGYIIMKYNADKKEYIEVKTIKGASNTSYTSNNLAKGTAYKYKVVAYKEYTPTGRIIKSEGVTLSVTTNIPPKKVTNLKAATIGKNSVNLTWSKRSNASGYIIMKYNAAKKQYIAVKTIEGASNTSYTSKSLAKGTEYKYKVVAYTDTSNGKIKSEGVTLSVTTKE